jgi:hypothetical protein
MPFPYSCLQANATNPQIVLNLVLPLVRTDELITPSDAEGMLAPWIEKNKDIKKQLEPSKEVRQALLECLLLLARSREVREYMRKVQVCC